MAFIRNLDERYHKTITELYAGIKDMKDPSALNPIMIVGPNDPNRQVGVGNSNRLVPIRHVTIDETRMTRFLTSPRGIEFLIKQQVLQGGNAISETRQLNPLFININLSPNAHFKRSLFDQTGVVLGSIERSPASVDGQVGIAGRLQRETAQSATAGVVGSQTGRSVLSILNQGQALSVLTGLLGIGGNLGTLGVNERPEFFVGDDKRLYVALLREGYSSTSQRELSILMSALGAAGTAASIFGLPNIFSEFTIGSGQAPNPIPSQLKQMRYGVVNETEAVRYLPAAAPTRNPKIFRSTSFRIEAAQRGLNLLANGFFGASLGFDRTLRRAASGVSAVLSTVPQLFAASSQQILINVPTEDDLLSPVSEPDPTKTTEEQLEFPDDALGARYKNEARLEFTRAALAEQATLIERYTDTVGTEENPNRGMGGGITLDKLREINTQRVDLGTDPFTDDQRAQQWFGSLPRRTIGVNTDKTAPGYYIDQLNLITRQIKTEGQWPPTDKEGIPQDYINFVIYDTINDRLEPFRAMLEGLSETITPEFNETRYIGRIERNIVYLGATRQLAFTLYINAWSPVELQSVWDKINFITGLAFPSKVSSDGFLVPPIVELTIGDYYTQQPGYFTGITHTIEDGTPWEIEPSAQVPHRMQMSLTFDVIEKESMIASSQFYGFGQSVSSIVAEGIGPLGAIGV